MKKIIFRQKGERKEFIIDSTLGGFYISINSGEKIVNSENMPEVVDLTHIPVVTIGGGKGKIRDSRLAEFKKNAPDFNGAILLFPYSWSNGWDDGILLLPNEALLDPSKKVSGGKPEVIFDNFRFLHDGRYVADQVKKLHGKIIKTLAVEVEQTPGAGKIAEGLSAGYSKLDNNLYRTVQEVIKELRDLEARRVLLTGGETRNISLLVKDFLTLQLEKVGVQKIADIPTDFSITAEEILTELVAQKATVGKIFISGLGLRDLAERESFFIGSCAVVELSFEDLKSVTEWPHINVGIRVTEFLSLGYSYKRDFEYGELHDLLFKKSEDRWSKILEYFQKRWVEIQREKEYPKDQELPDAKEVDLPPVSLPVVWGYDFISGQTFTAYAGVHHSVLSAKGRIYDAGWSMKWFDSAEEASQIDSEAREEARSYQRSREIKSTNSQHVLTNWGGHFRRMGAASNEDYFVVSYDGLIRKADKIEYRKAYFSEGEKMWDIVGENEIALYWSQYDGLTIVKDSMEYTEAQEKAIEQIAIEVGVVEAVHTNVSGENTPIEKAEDSYQEREITFEDIKNLQQRFKK